MLETPTLTEASESIHTLFNFDDASSVSGDRRIIRAAISLRTDDSAWEEPIDIPLKLYSTESRRFVGFKRSAAEEIMRRFRHPVIEHSNMAIDFVAFMDGFLRDCPQNAFGAASDDEWDAALKQMCVKRAVREGILDPDFENLRMCKSAKEWAIETVEDGWVFLTGMDAAVKRNEEKIAQGFRDGGPGVRAKRRAEMASE
jgi:hypothetical protein